MPFHNHLHLIIYKEGVPDCYNWGSRGQVPVTPLTTQREGLEEALGMPDVNFV